MRQQYPQNPEVREIQSLRLKKKEGLDLIQKHLRWNIQETETYRQRQRWFIHRMISLKEM